MTSEEARKVAQRALLSFALHPTIPIEPKVTFIERLFDRAILTARLEQAKAMLDDYESAPTIPVAHSNMRFMVEMLASELEALK